MFPEQWWQWCTNELPQWGYLFSGHKALLWKWNSTKVFFFIILSAFFLFSLATICVCVCVCVFLSVIGATFICATKKQKKYVADTACPYLISILPFFLTELWFGVREVSPAWKQNKTTSFSFLGLWEVERWLSSVGGRPNGHIMFAFSYPFFLQCRHDAWWYRN